MVMEPQKKEVQIIIDIKGMDEGGQKMSERAKIKLASWGDY